MTVSEHQTDDPAADALAALSEAAAEYREARDAVEEHGREQLEALADAHGRAVELLVQYEDKATDTGAKEFVEFAQFKGTFTTHVEELDDDLPRRDAFEAALDAVDKTRLSGRDFERAREALAPAAELTDRLDRLEAARDRLVEARKRARRRREELESAIAERERLLELGEADLDAPVEELREPVRTWNEGAEAAVSRLRSEVPARELFEVLERAEQYPLVDLPRPSADLRAYVAEAEVGAEPLTRLLEYAEFSRSKLDHYVDDADAFRRAVAPERSALEAFDAAPLRIAWPPPPAPAVPWLARSRRSVVAGYVEESAVASLRRLSATARSTERYERLRTAAVADAELDDADRRRLESGAVESELAARREAIDRIDDRLDATPDP